MGCSVDNTTHNLVHDN